MKFTARTGSYGDQCENRKRERTRLLRGPGAAQPVQRVHPGAAREEPLQDVVVRVPPRVIPRLVVPAHAQEASAAGRRSAEHPVQAALRRLRRFPSAVLRVEGPFKATSGWS
eukprot:31550-Pelagococcus_subviridis.AAC.30